MKKALSAEQMKLIQTHGSLAREAWQSGDFQKAEQEMQLCWNCLPKPPTDYDYSESLARGIVTFYRDTQQYSKAVDWLETMRVAYGSTPNPSVNFMAGTVYFASGEADKAFGIFDDLFKQFGARPFVGENPEYLDFYKAEARSRKK